MFVVFYNVLSTFLFEHLAKHFKCRPVWPARPRQKNKNKIIIGVNRLTFIMLRSRPCIYLKRFESLARSQMVPFKTNPVHCLRIKRKRHRSYNSDLLAAFYAAGFHYVSSV